MPHISIWFGVSNGNILYISIAILCRGLLVLFPTKLRIISVSKSNQMRKPILYYTKPKKKKFRKLIIKILFLYKVVLGVHLHLVLATLGPCYVQPTKQTNC